MKIFHYIKTRWGKESFYGAIGCCILILPVSLGIAIMICPIGAYGSLIGVLLAFIIVFILIELIGCGIGIVFGLLVKLLFRWLRIRKKRVQAR